MTRKKTVTKATMNENKDSLREPLVPKTDGHKNYIRTIVENDVTFCIGPAGSSKSYTAIGLGCQYLLEGRYDKLIIARPAVESCGKGRGVGFLAGSLQDKLSEYVYPAVELIKRFLGRDRYYTMLRNESISFQALEFLRGRTFDYSYMILEEAQNCDTEQIKMFVSRIGEKSKIVISGDVDQSDLKRNDYTCDLEYVMTKVEKAQLDNFGICRLDEIDIVRNKLIGPFLNAIKT